MNTLKINLEINISELEIRDSKIAEPGTEWVTFAIENQEKIEAKIYQEFKRFVERKCANKTAVKSGASLLIEFPESFYLSDKKEA